MPLATIDLLHNTLQELAATTEFPQDDPDMLKLKRQLLSIVTEFEIAVCERDVEAFPQYVVLR